MNKGVYLSKDAGANWVSINEGLSTRAVTELAISSNGNTIYAATEGEGCFRLDRYSLSHAVNALKIAAGFEAESSSIEDVNSDEKIGLQEAIYALRAVGGL